MKVGEQVLYLARLKGLCSADAHRQINIWFEKFGIQSWKNRKVEELSKGMQQKVQFIATVLHRPSLLILDEPFSGFDPINTDMLKNEMLQLREQGTTILLSTHNMASVEEMCDYISLINQSHCILQGEVNRIRREYHSGEYELCFGGDGATLIEALKTSGYRISAHIQEKQNTKIMVQSLPCSGNDLLAQAIPLVKVISFNEVLPGMNEIFKFKVNEQNFHHHTS
jgi:ABC-2 type transport system ATP-binding protein